MNLPQEKRQELIQGLLPMLGPAIEPGVEYMPVSGSTLLSNGVTKDAENRLIIGSKQYLYPFEKMVDLDHTIKINKLIDEAKNQDEMVEKLSEHLAKWAISKRESN